MRDPSSAAFLRRDDARLRALHSAAAQRVGALLLEDGGDEAPTTDASTGATARRALATLACCGFFLLIARTDFHATDATGFLATPTIGASGSREVPTEDPRMRLNSKFGAMAGAVALSIGAQAVAQDAVQWRVEDGGNGHWYQLIHNGSYLCWSDANGRAIALGATLVSETSVSEHNFIADQFISRDDAWSGRFGPWIGAHRVNGAWSWTTGESWTFSAWYPGEPNGGSSEPVASYIAAGEGGGCGRTTTWNDWVDCGQVNSSGCDVGVWNYIVEWSADCNNDGLVDYGQIVAGELADANHNNIPDCCEQGAPCGCPADIAHDGVVNGIDLAAVLNNWGTTGGAINADVNRDGIVNGSDLAIVLNSWGPCP